MNVTIVNGKIFINGQPMHDDGTLAGNGDLGEESRALPPFQNIKADGALELIVQCGAMNHRVQIRCDSNLLPLVDTRVEDGTLRVGLKDHQGISALLPLRIDVAMERLDKVKLDGAVKATVGELRQGQIKARLHGCSRLELAGSLHNLEARLNGASALLAYELTAAHLVARLSGAARAEVNVQETLHFEGSGASQLSYRGRPQVQSEISGAASITAYL